MRDDIKTVFVSEIEIENIVNSLAKQIEKDYNCKEFVMIGLLKGSMVFMADLMRKIHLDFSVDFIVASSYIGAQSSKKVNISKDVSLDVGGKDVLIVEDIIDTGNTLEFITKHILDKNARSVKVCTLFDKPAGRTANVKPEYIGKTVPNEFIVGYGLDYNEIYRNLPYVGILDPSVYS